MAGLIRKLKPEYNEFPMAAAPVADRVSVSGPGETATVEILVAELGRQEYILQMTVAQWVIFRGIVNQAIQDANP